MLKYILTFFLFIITIGFAEEKGLKLTSDEGLFLRRIAEFHEEKEIDIVKKEINDYLSTREKDAFSDYLKGLLGDIFLEEKKFDEALGQYQSIVDPMVKEKIFFNLIQCLYETKSLDKVVVETKEYLKLQKETSPKAIFLLADTLYQLSLMVKDTEKQKQLLQESKSYYEQMLALENKESAYEPLAHIYEVLGQPTEAYKYYILLSQKESPEKEYFLFQAAQLACGFDKRKAMEHFDAIYALGGPKAFDAIYNKLLLHFEVQEYDAIIKASPDLFRKITKEQAIELRYIVGKSFFALKDYKKSIKHLKRFISLAGVKNERTHSALTYLMQAACEIKDVKTFFLASEHFKVYFPDDPEMAQVHYAHGLFHKQIKNYKEAFNDFEMIDAKYPEFAKKICFKLHAAELDYAMQNYDSAVKRLSSFYDKLDKPKERKEALTLLVNSSIHMQNNAKDKDSLVFQKLLVYINELVNLQTLDANEKLDLLFLRGHLEVQMGLYDGALNDLTFYQEHKNPKEINTKVYLLMALIHKEGKKDLVKFTNFAEKALDQDPVWAHQALYNAYRELSSANSEYLPKAADHLFHLMQRVSIDKTNLYWLSDYYFEAYMKNPTSLPLQDENFIRAKLLLEKLYLSREDNSADLEKIAIKLFELYSKESLLFKQKEVLLSLDEHYNKQTQEKFTFKPYVYYQIAALFEKEKNFLQMDHYYDKILNETEKNPYIAFAKLFKARKELENIPLEKFDVTNSQVIHILDELKNLKIQRHIASEPAHLEAALDLIDLEVALEKDKALEKKVFLLEKTLNDFKSTEDVLSKDYHTLREKLIDKNTLYLSYMQLMECELLMTKAYLQKDSELMTKAQELVQVLKSKILTSYEQKRLEKIQILVKENEKKN